MNLPNKLTVSRFILTAAFLIVFFTAWRYHETVALVLFCVASLTDYFDGMIARRDKLIVTFQLIWKRSFSRRYGRVQSNGT